MDEYVKALQREIRRKAMKDVSVSSVFIGGGTPSVLEGNAIDGIMSELNKAFRIQEDAEITIEANPGTITSEKAGQYLQSGINRVSLGLQTAQDTELKKLGRIHTWQQFQESYEILRMQGIQNINVDIMSGLPEQSTETYEDTLHKVCRLLPEHISAYSLIIEEGTPFYNLYNEESGNLKSELPTEEEERRQYYLTKSVLENYGYERYEISNYAKRGFECRHNIGYWTRKNYLGFGIGAASLYEQKRFHNTTNIKEYLKYADSPEMITEEIQKLSVKEQMEEYMFLGMRMMSGISKKAFKNTFQTEINEVYKDVIVKYTDLGMIKNQGDNLCLTEKGIDISNTIFADFLLD